MTTMTVQEAHELAVRAHGDQRDRDGSLHIDHVARVVGRLAAVEAHQRVGWLHDVIEDTETDPDLLRASLPDDEWAALVLLTRGGEQTYEAYVEAIARAGGNEGRIARAVKEADARDNLERCVAARDPAVARYGAVLARLWAAG